MATRYMFANYQTVDEASDAYAALLDEGFNPDEISVVATEESRKAFDRQTDSTEEERDDIGIGEGAAKGAVTGGLIGLIVSAVPLAIAGLPSLIVIGPISAALGLTGVAATTTTGALTGGVIGGLVGALDNFGVNKDAAKEYEETVKEGGVLVIVPVTMDSEDVTREMLDRSGAQTVQVGQVRE
jgi:uncharacterized membrane protein